MIFLSPPPPHDVRVIGGWYRGRSGRWLCKGGYIAFFLANVLFMFLHLFNSYNLHLSSCHGFHLIFFWSDISITLVLEMCLSCRICPSAPSCPPDISDIRYLFLWRAFMSLSTSRLPFSSVSFLLLFISMWRASLTHSLNLTEHLSIVEPWNLSVYKFYVVLKRRLSGFVALNLWNVRSGMANRRQWKKKQCQARSKECVRSRREIPSSSSSSFIVEMASHWIWLMGRLLFTGRRGGQESCCCCCCWDEKAIEMVGRKKEEKKR